MKKYRCTVCEYIYDPALGDPENGIAPGTAFDDLPDGWICPVCGEGGAQSGAQRLSPADRTLAERPLTAG